ncbi:H-NS histone family protein [Burkholderia sp. OK233]|nr:H-NS histone family protein [Burkholderia sp. OK233]
MIRYRDAYGNAWTGLGEMPQWLHRAVAAGQSIDHFRTRRFNGCVQRKNVRLKCDTFDDGDDVDELVGALPNGLHRVDYLSHGFAAALRRADRPVHRGRSCVDERVSAPLNEALAKMAHMGFDAFTLTVLQRETSAVDQ